MAVSLLGTLTDFGGYHDALEIVCSKESSEYYVHYWSGSAGGILFSIPENAMNAECGMRIRDLLPPPSDFLQVCVRRCIPVQCTEFRKNSPGFGFEVTKNNSGKELDAESASYTALQIADLKE